MLDGQLFYGGAQEGVCFHERIHTAVFYFVERQGSMTPQRLPDMLIGGLVQLLQLRGLPGDAIARAMILTLNVATPKMTTVQPWVV